MTHANFALDAVSHFVDKSRQQYFRNWIVGMHYQNNCENPESDDRARVDLCCDILCSLLQDFGIDAYTNYGVDISMIIAMHAYGMHMAGRVEYIGMLDQMSSYYGGNFGIPQFATGMFCDNSEASHARASQHANILLEISNGFRTQDIAMSPHDPAILDFAADMSATFAEKLA